MDIQELFQRNKTYFRQCLQHEFVVKMFDGTLEIEKYKEYLIQDAIYLSTFTEVHKELIALSEEQHKDYFEERLRNLEMAELEIREELLKNLGITEKEIQPEKANEVTKSYQAYLYAALKSRNIGEIMVSLLPCYWIYQYIGEKGVVVKTKENPFTPWIATYKNEEYSEIVKEHIQFCTKYVENIEDVAELFEQGCKLEVAFFDRVK
ncbi:thiaminase (transcriptional activator TenA) [Pilibacter termitis]|uniref:Aminopyrimidine aminohydrolase n=1 Tax=Pilibacter termitis TaxID=263852 RepID=A0A1T4L3P7_9ENTE|nr:TenA family protein [Pilibacter termitis]SJZ49345.1 thiaminase (transcriptional activator TenA) [Pilibacter termitis]